MSKSGENPAADDTAASSAPPDAAAETDAPALAEPPAPAKKKKAVPEIGGPSGLEPTRYGDWERKGRCIDF